MHAPTGGYPRTVNDDPTLTCSRCGRQARLSKASDWAARFEQGALSAVYCPRCQSEAEHVEGQVNLATMEFEIDDKGEVHGKPKDEG